MKTKTKISLCELLAVAALLGAAAPACKGDTPTTVVIANGYPAGGDAAAGAPVMTVYKAWWVTTLFPDPVAPGETSATQRTIPASDFAYALLAPDWSPGDGAPPARLIAMKSVQKLTASANELFQIAISDDLFAGDCAAGKPLSAADAALIVESIFPGDFAGMTYDAATCQATPRAPADASVEAPGG